MTAGVIRYSCAFLFVLFSCCYLYFMQGDLLAQVQYVFSHGVTTYSILIGAFIITGVLQIVQWIVAKVLCPMPDRWYALTYLPSFLLLAMLTSWNEESLHHFHLGGWAWAAPVMLFLFAIAVYLLKHAEKNGVVTNAVDMPAKLWTNYLVLFALILFCGSRMAVKDVYLYELKTERLLMERRYEEALDVGRKSQQTSRRLSYLRAYALSKTGQLPERLFDYPQPYGVDGLLAIADTSKAYHQFDAANVCFSLGALCGKGMRSTENYFLRLMNFQQQVSDSLAAVDSLYLSQSDSVMAAYQHVLQSHEHRCRRTYDYYLCLLLLKRDLPAFTDAFRQYYPDVVEAAGEDSTATVVADIPRAYREALVMGRDSLMMDTATLATYRAYRTMCDTLRQPTVRRNLTRRRFGTTYWWYFDHPRQ